MSLVQKEQVHHTSTVHSRIMISSIKRIWNQIIILVLFTPESRFLLLKGSGTLMCSVPTPREKSLGKLFDFHFVWKGDKLDYFGGHSRSVCQNFLPPAPPRFLHYCGGLKVTKISWKTIVWITGRDPWLNEGPGNLMFEIGTVFVKRKAQLIHIRAPNCWWLNWLKSAVVTVTMYRGIRPLKFIYGKNVNSGSFNWIVQLYEPELTFFP